MNKKEQASFDRMAQHIRAAESLHITPIAEPDVHAGGVQGSVSRESWAPNLCRDGFVEIRRPDKYHPAVYSSVLLAMQAARNQVERDSGLRLAKIDAAIAAEIERLKCSTP